MHLLGILLIYCVSVFAAQSNPQRIVGGSVTTIDSYPEIVTLLFSWVPATGDFRHRCGGSILNNRAILTAAHCTFYAPARWRSRVGSSYANSGGIVYDTSLIINHPSYNSRTYDNDVAIIRILGNIEFTNVIQPASIAGANYDLGDNQLVWVAGWGNTSQNGWPSEQLRHVQLWTVNQATCRARYAGDTVTDNMLCSGWLDDGRGHCQGDAGGPLYHNRVIVGVSSWGVGCAQARYPGVYARVSRFTPWIQALA